MQNDSTSNSSSAAIWERTQKVVTPLLVWWWSFWGRSKWLPKWGGKLLCNCTGEGDSLKLACEGYWATGSETDCSLQALGSKTLFPFHGQAPVYQHDLGYFGRLREPLPVPPGLQCVPSPVLLFVMGSSAYPEAFLLTQFLITVLKPWSPVWRQLFKPSNKQCIKWYLPFILTPLCFHLPSGHADRGWTSKMATQSLRLCIRSKTTKHSSHLRQTHWLPWNPACCLNPAFLKGFSCHKKLSQLSPNKSSLRPESMKVCSTACLSTLRRKRWGSLRKFIL